LRTIALLTVSDIFMTFAWYGHLKYRSEALWKVVLASWSIAFFEYCFQVPGNRIGSYEFNAAQLKTIQEVITLGVFAVFCRKPTSEKSSSGTTASEQSAWHSPSSSFFTSGGARLGPHNFWSPHNDLLQPGKVQQWLLPQFHSQRLCHRIFRKLGPRFLECPRRVVNFSAQQRTIWPPGIQAIPLR
jgi:uncharacterized protein